MLFSCAIENDRLYGIQSIKLGNKLLEDSVEMCVLKLYYKITKRPQCLENMNI